MTRAVYAPKHATGVAVEPAALGLHGPRQVPVVERRHRFDAGLEQGVDESVVEGESDLAGRAGARRLVPGP